MFWIFEIEPPEQSARRNGRVLLQFNIFEPSEEQIRQRAYEIFIERGGDLGNEQADWEQAERELRARQDANS